MFFFNKRNSIGKKAKEVGISIVMLASQPGMPMGMDSI